MIFSAAVNFGCQPKVEVSSFSRLALLRIWEAAKGSLCTFAKMATDSTSSDRPTQVIRVARG